MDKVGGVSGRSPGPGPARARISFLLALFLTLTIVAKTTAANRHDVPAIKGKAGAPRYRFDELYAERAYDYEADRQALREIGAEPYIPPRGTEHGSGLGKVRRGWVGGGWVVERTISWLHRFRRLRIRYERRLDIHEAFPTIGCVLICHRMFDAVFC